MYTLAKMEDAALLHGFTDNGPRWTNTKNKINQSRKINTYEEAKTLSLGIFKRFAIDTEVIKIK